MSFISNIFKGATNDFNPSRAYAPGTQAWVQDVRPQMGIAANNYNSANSGFDSLAQALQQQMKGGGPNLANAQLASATAQNVGNQAALMGGQRGASSNVGLMSRQIANQGANIQQQAAGQSAQNVLAQQLAAQQQLGNVYGQQGSLANQNLGIQQAAFDAQNKNIIGDIQGNNQIGSHQASENASANRSLIGGVANAGMGLLGMANGGQVPNSNPIQGWQGQSDWGFNFVSGKKPQVPSISSGIAIAAQGGVANNLPFAPHDYRQGGVVKANNPKQKAIAPGNNYKNDKIPAMLSEKEVVLPREVTQSPNAPQAAAQFMAQVMAGKHKVKRG